MKKNKLIVAIYIVAMTSWLAQAEEIQTCVPGAAETKAAQSIVMLYRQASKERPEFYGVRRAVVVSPNRLLLLGEVITNGAPVPEIYIGTGDKRQVLKCIVPKAFKNAVDQSTDHYCRMDVSGCEQNIAVCTLANGKNFDVLPTPLLSQPISSQKKGQETFMADFFWERPPEVEKKCLFQGVVERSADYKETSPPYHTLLLDAVDRTVHTPNLDRFGGPWFVKENGQVKVAGLIMGRFGVQFYSPIQAIEFSKESPLDGFLKCALASGPLPARCP